jgi:hypothetical protein
VGDLHPLFFASFPAHAASGHSRRFLRVSARSAHPPKLTVKANVADWQSRALLCENVLRRNSSKNVFSVFGLATDAVNAGGFRSSEIETEIQSAVELVAQIKTHAVSPVEVLDSHLAMIARVNPKLNAIVTLVADIARKQRRPPSCAVMRSDRCTGLPLGVKDVTRTAEIRSTHGSALYKDFVPDEDAEVVRRLKAPGAVLLAKTNRTRTTPRP